jgi:predicted lipoprotein with Yx(FWY)xxD motif
VFSRKMGIAAVGAALAALALTGCAPKGTGTNDYQAGDQTNLTNATPSADPTASAAAPQPSESAKAAPVRLTTKLTAKTIAKMGKVVVDQDGWVLYRFDKDTTNPVKSNCVDKCTKVWPAALTDGNPELNGVDPALVGTVTRDDGTTQITLNKWPLYRYIGDKTPGKWSGQNVGGVWFVSAPDGKKNLTCLPTPAPKAVEPPADDSTADNSSSNDSGNNSGY